MFRISKFELRISLVADIPLLVDHFVQKLSWAMNKRVGQVAPSAMRLLQHADWPGNVRELENAIERAMVVAREPELREVDFTLKLMPQKDGPKTLEDAEREHILRVLDECGGNQSRAAEALDIDRVQQAQEVRLEQKAG